MAFDVNAESKCTLKSESLILNAYESSVNQLYTLNKNGGIDLNKVKYNDEFEKKIVKSIFNNKKKYCNFDYSSYSLNNKVFGVIVLNYNNLNDLKNDFKEVVKQKGFSDKKVITTFKVSKDDRSIYLFYGNYMYLEEPSKTINAIY